MNTPLPHIFQEIRLNATLTLPNRLIMAPLTRCMAQEPELVPAEGAPAYYARRAGAGLMISEATIIRPDAQGYPRVPGIFSKQQVAGWRRVTDAVHEAGGLFFMQLWHVGRVSHPFFLHGEAPLAPSAVALEGKVNRMPHLHYGMPRALELAEIPGLVKAYARAAHNAMEAGCDGVEIHGANGYLIDQFLHAFTNRRTDTYGGSVINRCRFALEVMDAVCAEVGAERVGLRLSPAAYFFQQHHEQDVPTYTHLLAELASRGLAYIHTGIFDDSKHYDYLEGTATAFLRKHYQGMLMGCGGYTPEAADHAIAQGAMDMIALGRPFLANPDLVSLLANGRTPKTYEKSMLHVLN